MSENQTKSALQALETKLAKGSISRRDFMLGVTALSATLLAEKAEATSPKSGGLFRVGISEGDTADSLDPARTANQCSIHMAHTFRNFLTEIGPENELVGELAESWESNSDATEWHFKLRRGIEFHNGKTMDSADVVASINHHRGKDSVSAAKPLLAAINDIVVDGKNTVTFTLASGNADFPYVLTDYHLNIVPANGHGGVDWRSGVGTGAFVLENFQPGVSAKFKRNPNFWKEGRGHFDEGELLVISDPNARETALISNQIDTCDQASLKTIHLMARRDDVVIDNVTSWAHMSLPMHMDVEPFTNNDVRLAFKYGINRQELLDKILHGYGSLGNDHPISPAIQFHADIEQRPYDPDKAKFHLKKAGYEKLKVSLSTAEVAGAGSVDAAVLYQQNLAPIGIDLKVVREPNDGYWSNIWLVKPFCVVFWGGRPTADVMFTTAYAAGADWNESHLQNDRFNKLLVAARGELDTAKRTEMYREMQVIVRDDGATVVPLFRNHVYLRRGNVAHGPNLSANWQLDGNRAMERWWFA